MVGAVAKPHPVQGRALADQFGDLHGLDVIVAVLPAQQHPLIADGDAAALAVAVNPPEHALTGEVVALPGFAAQGVDHRVARLAAHQHPLPLGAYAIVGPGRVDGASGQLVGEHLPAIEPLAALAFVC